MKVVLSNYRDEFFRDSYGDYGGNRITNSVSQAEIFTITIENGNLKSSPTLPDGDWTLVPITINCHLLNS